MVTSSLHDFGMFVERAFQIILFRKLCSMYSLFLQRLHIVVLLRDLCSTVGQIVLLTETALGRAHHEVARLFFLHGFFLSLNCLICVEL